MKAMKMNRYFGLLRSSLKDEAHEICVAWAAVIRYEGGWADPIRISKTSGHKDGRICAGAVEFISALSHE